MYKFKRDIPLDSSYEVIVIGGGPAGCMAAASAAREGAKTLLIEQTSSLGGMGTIGLVPAWTPFSNKEQIVYKGLAEEVFTRLKKQMPHVKPDDVDWVPIDSEALKRIYDDMVTSFGAKILFNTFLCDVDTDGEGNITALIVSNKSGMKAFQARVYVDCTGDADVAYYAGAEYQKGDEEGTLQPATLCFKLSNVDVYGFQTMPKLRGEGGVIDQIVKDGKYPLISRLNSVIVGPGTAGFNAGHVFGVDSTNPETVSEGLILGRKIALEYRNALAEYVPQTFGNAFLVQTGTVLGIRESRRIIGDYILTIDDYAERRTFPDEVCRNCYYIDVHGSVEAALAEGKLMKYRKGESHGIPYRCLTPKGLNNLLVAGRSISCERMVQGSVRVMPVCLAMGEAAGMAAKYAADNGGDVRKVDVDKLRTRIKEVGMYIH